MIIKRKSNKLSSSHKIQDGEVLYSDLFDEGKTIFSKKYMLSGKPDYILKREGSFYPVEFKTASCDKPMKNHVIQLAAYCHLVEQKYNCFVPCGILVYNQRKHYKIEFNPGLRFDLDKTISNMKSIIKKGNTVFSPDYKSPKCVNCSMRRYCNMYFS